MSVPVRVSCDRCGKQVEKWYGVELNEEQGLLEVVCYDCVQRLSERVSQDLLVH